MQSTSRGLETKVRTVMGRSWPACLAACRSDTHLIGSATVIVACSKFPDQGPVRPGAHPRITPSS